MEALLTVPRQKGTGVRVLLGAYPLLLQFPNFRTNLKKTKKHQQSFFNRKMKRKNKN